MKVMVSDCETGGLDPDKHSLLSVAAVVIDLDDGKIHEQWEAYHRLPNIEWYQTTPQALAVNKLDVNEVFEKGMTSEDLCAKLVDTWQNHSCVANAGQNWNFDRKFLARRLFRVPDDEFERIFSRQRRFNVMDTLAIARLLTGQLPVKAMGLKHLVKAFGVDMSDFKGGYHEALYDTVATARLLYKQKEALLAGFRASTASD